VSYASGTLTVVDDVVAVTPAQNTPIGPEVSAVVGLSGTHAGANVIVEGRIGSGSIWYPIGTITGNTFAPTNGSTYTLATNGTAVLRGAIAGYSEVRARLTAISSGSVAAEVDTQPAGSVSGSGGTIIATVPATSTFSAGITFNGATGANDLVIPDNLADALSILEAANVYLRCVTTNGSESVQLGQATTVTSAGANALAVGPNGATNPTLKVDGSTASAATGLQVKSAAAAGGLALSVISSGTNEALTLDSKGTGTLTLNGTATGGITTPRTVTTQSGQAATAGGGAAVLAFGADGLGIYFGSGAPTISAAKGSLYVRTDGSSTSTRVYVNNGTTNWVAVTTAS
jgi:hypothetical protein